MKQYAQTLNLIGTGCPMNFVLIKTALDRMPPGELLQVFLDRGQGIPGRAVAVREESARLCRQGA